MIRVRWQNVLCILYRVNCDIFVNHLIVDYDIAKPFSSNTMMLLHNHLLSQTIKLFQVFMLTPISFDFLNKFLFHKVNASDNLSSFQLLRCFINTFFLILDAEFRIQSGVFLKDEAFIVASELSFSVDQPRNLRRRKVTLKMRSICEHYVHRAKITSDSCI